MGKGIIGLGLGVFVLLWTGIVQALIPLQQVTDDLRQHLQGEFPSRVLKVGDIVLRSPDSLKHFYEQRAYRPAWLDGTGLLAAADDLLVAVTRAQTEGLQPADYHAHELITALTAARHASSARRLAELELLLTDAFLTYGSHRLAGRLTPQKIEEHQWTLKSRSRDLVPVLQDALNGGTIAESLDALSPPYSGYQRLRQALSRYRQIAWSGGWPRVGWGPNLELGMQDPRVRELRERLLITGDLDDVALQMAASAGMIRTVSMEPVPDAGLDSQAYFDSSLAQAVRRFQRRHGLADDGIVGPRTLAQLNVPVEERMRQIELNMERWRWLPEDLGRRYILINIPGFELRVMEGDRQIMEARVVVGKSVQPTPVFTGSMSYLVLNPYWNIPRSIAVEEMLPQLRDDPYALAEQNIRIFDLRNGGQEIDPGEVDWQKINENNFPFRLRQDPGSNNALGRIKFMFPNRHSVYLHDTPARHLFNRTQRTFSHGCIRLSRPFELAEYLLQDNPRWTGDALISAARGEQERTVRLSEKIPVHILYLTAWADEDGTVQFRNDVYERDEPLIVALNRID